MRVARASSVHHPVTRIFISPPAKFLPILLNLLRTKSHRAATTRAVTLASKLEEDCLTIRWRTDGDPFSKGGIRAEQLRNPLFWQHPDLLYICTRTHSNTSDKDGEGQTECCGQFSHRNESSGFENVGSTGDPIGMNLRTRRQRIWSDIRLLPLLEGKFD